MEGALEGRLGGSHGKAGGAWRLRHTFLTSTSGTIQYFLSIVNINMPVGWDDQAGNPNPDREQAHESFDVQGNVLGSEKFRSRSQD